MKTFDEECRELYDWLLEKNEECRAAEEKEKPKGHDSKANHQFRLYVAEYNEKLKALKKKYNIE